MTILVLTLVELPGIEEKNVGVATGLFFSAAEVGGVLGPMSLGLLYDWTNGFNTGLFMLTGVAMMIFLGTLRLKRLCRG
jgi:cyanate permease